MIEITTAKAAEIANLCESRIRQFARAGDLKHSRKIGAIYLFDQKEVRKFLAKPRRGRGRPKLDAK